MSDIYIYRLEKEALRNNSTNILARHMNIENLKFLTSRKPLSPNRVPNGAVVLNYGRSPYPEWLRGREHQIKIINRPESVALSVDKIKMYKKFNEHNIPCFEWCQRKEDITWQDDTVVRTIIDGHSGQGIVFVPRGRTIPDAPIYLKRENFVCEQRLFIVDDEIVVTLEKKRMMQRTRNRFGIRGVNPDIRCFRNGWAYCQTRFTRPITQELKDLCFKVKTAFNFDFCVVDVGRYEDGGYKVIEVSSEPGIWHVSPIVQNKFAQSLKALINKRVEA